MAQSNDGQEMAISWAGAITTRNGSLTTDSKLVNAFVEDTPNGKAIVKRPGSAYMSTITGTAQGIFTNGGVPYFIVNDTAYQIIPPNQGTAIPIPSVLNPGIAYTYIDSFSVSSPTIIQHGAELWTFNGSSFTKVTDVNFTTTAPQTGMAFLDGVFYAITQVGNVIGSAINDPTTWPALDFVGADREYGSGVTVSRHLNYILAFYSAGLQVYYDGNAAPNGSGIALLPVLSAAFRTGAFSPYVVSEINDITYFMGTSPLYGRTVQMMNGLTLQKISTEYIEKILNQDAINPTDNGQTWSFGISIAGHSFYVLTIGQINTTLVYDIISGIWSVWTSVVSGVEGKYTGRFYAPVNNQITADNGDYVQDTSTGRVMLLSTTLFTDATGPIHVTAVTQNLDWGTLNWKRFGYMYQLADTIPTTISVSYSDNDYGTFSTPRTIDLSTVRKQMRNCGASRRRAWMLQHSDNQPLRVYDMKASTTGLPR